MANKTIFGSGVQNKVKCANTVNAAGGKAYSRSDESALAQTIVTGCLNGTFYASAGEQLDSILASAAGCSNDFLAKAAVYARKNAKMKDTPALLAAILTTRGEQGTETLESIWPQVIDNQKQLRNFVQIVRSGKVGRKSFGTAVKRMIQNAIHSQEPNRLFYQSVGQSPSLKDVVKLVHPKPISREYEAFFGWLLGKPYNNRVLPSLVKQFEKFKDKTSSEVPDVDFRMLTALDLTTEQWKQVGRQAGWNMIRMNLNTFQRHKCFEDSIFVQELAEKLCDKNEVIKSSVFPYQLMTSYKATLGQVPIQLSNALQSAMETATQNVPALSGKTAVAVDVSGSMHSAITGNIPGATTNTRCVEVAGLIASTIIRKNPDAIVIPFDTAVKNITLNPFDSIMTNAQRLNINGGGTACHIVLDHLLVHNIKVDNVIYVSDNESWHMNAVRHSGLYHGGTSMAQSWQRYKDKNRKTKLVCIDLVPNITTQVLDNKDCLNVGGFSDAVYDVIKNFVEGDSRDFAKIISDS